MLKQGDDLSPMIAFGRTERIVSVAFACRRTSIKKCLRNVRVVLKDRIVKGEIPSPS